MFHFKQELIQNLETDPEALKSTREQLQKLHQAVYEQIRLNKIDLNLIHSESQTVQQDSVSDNKVNNALSVVYLRTRGQAVQVERLLGREEVANINAVEARRHPVIEIRVSAQHLAVELILSPDAWWDQQNLVGKMTVPRYRLDFYTLLQQLDIHYCLGFWRGVHLSEMHLSGKHFRHPRILDEWLSTFQPSADCLRLGIWYKWDDAIWQGETVAEIAKQVKALFGVYQHILWTSDNNFREFYLNSR